MAAKAAFAVFLQVAVADPGAMLQNTATLLLKISAPGSAPDEFRVLGSVKAIGEVHVPMAVILKWPWAKVTLPPRPATFDHAELVVKVAVPQVGVAVKAAGTESSPLPCTSLCVPVPRR